MKEAKYDETAIVSNCRTQASAATELYVGTHDLALYLNGFARADRSDGYDSRPVFIAERQMEKQVLQVIDANRV
jgi:hypothetical protein